MRWIAFLTLSAMLGLFAIPSHAPGQGKGKTTIKVKTQSWSPGGGYKPLPGVKIFVSRGGARVSPPDEDRTAWLSDKNGQITIELSSGDPVTLVLHMSSEYVPELQQLTADVNETHQIGAGLKTLKDHREYEKANPEAPRAVAQLARAERLLRDAKGAGQADKDAVGEIRKLREQARPRSSQHPDLSKPEKQVNLNTEEQKTVNKCLTLIKACRMKNGAIRTIENNGVIDPYYAHYAALALLAAEKPNKADIEIVSNWLQWYHEHLEEPAGVAPRYESNPKEGYVRVKEDEKAYNSIDGTAGIFLLVVARYHKVTGKTPDQITAAAISSLGTIRGLVQADGLTMTTPDSKTKFLVSNLEVYAGLVEGGRFFKAIGREEEAEESFQTADDLGAAMATFWQNGHYARSVDDEGKAEGGLKEKNEILANLYGLASVHPFQPDLWDKLQKEFDPDGEKDPNRAETPVEQWLLAAPKNDWVGWRKSVVATAEKFTTKTHLHRAAITVLALTGSSRFPTVLPTPESFEELAEAKKHQDEKRIAAVTDYTRYSNIRQRQVQFKLDWSTKALAGKEVWVCVVPSDSPDYVYHQEPTPLQPKATTARVYLGEKDKLKEPATYKIVLVAVPKGSPTNNKGIEKEKFDSWKPLYLHSFTMKRSE